jgi:hypothetical protein
MSTALSAPPPSMLNYYRGPVKKLTKKQNNVLPANNSVLQNVTNPQHAPVNTNNSNTRRKKMLASLSGFKSSAIPKKVTMAKRGGKKSKTRKARK